MKRTTTWRTIGWLGIAALAGGCGSTNPTTTDLTGRWVATINADGIDRVQLDLTERGNEVSGSGQWTPLQTGATSLPVSAAGLHFTGDISLTLTFTTAGQSKVYTTTGQVESPSAFYLIFPGSNTPLKAQFRRL